MSHNTDNAFSGSDLSPTRLTPLLHAEFTAFERDYLNHPIMEVQDLRALLLAWFAVFLPEAYSRSLIDDIREFRRAATHEHDYAHHGWYRLLPIDIALYAATGNLHHIDNHRLNFDHHKSTMRWFIHQCLALVADRLDFDDPELLARCEANLRVLHGACEWSAVLLLMAKGYPEAKLMRLRSWLERYDLNSSERELLRTAADGGEVPNSFFAPFLNWITRYVLVRLMGCNSPAESTAPTSGPQALPAGIVWKRLSNHPFGASDVTMPFGRAGQSA